MKLVVIQGSGLYDEAALRYAEYIGGDEDFIESSAIAYWFNRLADNRELLAPGDPARLIQIVDVARISNSSVESELKYEPSRVRITIQSLLEEMRSACRSTSTFTWVSDVFLKRHDCTSAEIPLWLLDQPESFGVGADPVNFELRRSVSEIIADCYLSFTRVPGTQSELKYLSKDQEIEFLRQWHQLSVPYRSDSARLDGI